MIKRQAKIRDDMGKNIEALQKKRVAEPFFLILT
jgi:hypothetical protein